MIARIHPAPLAGTVPAIASKSMAHRMIIAAALADAPTRVVCDTTCEDIEATVRCLRALGARVERDGGAYAVEPVLQGAATRGAVLDCGESGSTLRFMLPVACALGADATFTGARRLGERPISPLTDELIAGGCEVGGVGSFPLTVSGSLRPGRFELPGDVSSQYISGLLLAAAVMDRPSEIRVSGAVESRPYVNLTLKVLDMYGVPSEAISGQAPDGGRLTVFRVEGGGFHSPGQVAVEGDWSNAAFWLCAGALGGSPVSVEGLDLASPQGDRTILAALSRFGTRIVRSTGSATVVPERLAGFDLDARDVPDLVPVISAVASCAEGTTRIRNCGRLRLKESDRLQTTTETLRALGACIEVSGDDLVIEGRERLAGGTVASHNDHRIAMMAAVAATRCERPVEIRGAEAVAKSYPAFFDHYRLLGGSVETLEG